MYDLKNINRYDITCYDVDMMNHNGWLDWLNYLTRSLDKCRGNISVYYGAPSPKSTPSQLQSSAHVPLCQTTFF